MSVQDLSQFQLLALTVYDNYRGMEADGSHTAEMELNGFLSHGGFMEALQSAAQIMGRADIQQEVPIVVQNLYAPSMQAMADEAQADNYSNLPSDIIATPNLTLEANTDSIFDFMDEVYDELDQEQAYHVMAQPEFAIVLERATALGYPEFANSETEIETAQQFVRENPNAEMQAEAMALFNEYVAPSESELTALQSIRVVETPEVAPTASPHPDTFNTVAAAATPAPQEPIRNFDIDEVSQNLETLYGVSLEDFGPDGDIGYLLASIELSATPESETAIYAVNDTIRTLIGENTVDAIRFRREIGEDPEGFVNRYDEFLTANPDPSVLDIHGFVNSGENLDYSPEQIVEDMALAEAVITEAEMQGIEVSAPELQAEMATQHGFATWDNVSGGSSLLSTPDIETSPDVNIPGESDAPAISTESPGLFGAAYAGTMSDIDTETYEQPAIEVSAETPPLSFGDVGNTTNGGIDTAFPATELSWGTALDGMQITTDFDARMNLSGVAVGNFAANSGIVPASTPLTSTEMGTHEVQRGDTLWEVVEDAYPELNDSQIAQAVMHVAHANPNMEHPSGQSYSLASGANAGAIFPDQTISLPHLDIVEMEMSPDQVQEFWARQTPTFPEGIEYNQPQQAVGQTLG